MRSPSFVSQSLQNFATGGNLGVLYNAGPKIWGRISLEWIKIRICGSWHYQLQFGEKRKWLTLLSLMFSTVHVL